MADIAGVIGTFINIVLDSYKLIVIRQSSGAALKANIENWVNYQDRMKVTLQFAVSPTFKEYYNVVDQASWVLNQDATMLQWLSDAGFRRTQDTSKIIIKTSKTGVSRRQSTMVLRNPGPLKFPPCGVTEKAKDFDQMFERLRLSFERLQSMMSDPPPPGGGSATAPNAASRPPGRQSNYFRISSEATAPSGRLASQEETLNRLEDRLLDAIKQIEVNRGGNSHSRHAKSDHVKEHVKEFDSDDD